MSRVRAHSAALVVMCSVALITGCAAPSVPSASVSASPTPSPALTSAPTPTPTPAATAETQDPADPSTWLVTTSSIGPARLGDPDEDALAHIFEPAFTMGLQCEGLTAYDPTNAASTLHMTTAVSGHSTAERPGYFRAVMASDWSASASGPVPESPHTAAGIVLGSSYDDLAAAYPDLQPWEHPRAVPDQTTTYYVISDSEGSLVFQVDAGRVVKMTATFDLPPVGYCS